MKRKLMKVKNTKSGVQCVRYRVTVPIELARALGWKAGDELRPRIHKGGILFKKEGGK